MIGPQVDRKHCRVCKKRVHRIFFSDFVYCESCRLWAKGLHGKSKAILIMMHGPFCVYCKKRYPIKVLEVDHIVPKSKGGEDGIWNFALACWPCNVRKNGNVLTDELRDFLASGLPKREWRERNKK